MFAFIGLLLEAGVMHDGGRYLIELYDERRGNPIFKATMTFQRFKHILHLLQFNNKTTREQGVKQTNWPP